MGPCMRYTGRVTRGQARCERFGCFYSQPAWFRSQSTWEPLENLQGAEAALRQYEQSKAPVMPLDAQVLFLGVSFLASFLSQSKDPAEASQSSSAQVGAQ